MPFRNRIEAGRKLADLVAELPSMESPFVVALPRGGAPLAQEVAERLDAPLEVLVVAKISAPESPEYGIGAITEGGYHWLNPDALNSLNLNTKQLREWIRFKWVEVEARIRKYRGGRPFPDLHGHTVIVVDDGVATGVTSAVASRYLKNRGAKEVILATPVCSRNALPFIQAQVDRVVCLEEPDSFVSVGQWYDNFSPVDDEDVLEILANRKKGAPEPTHASFVLPDNPKGVVIFAHGTGSNRLSPRNRQVSQALNEAGFGTLLFDLLTEDEAKDTGRLFDIPVLASRLVSATHWARRKLGARGFHRLPLGYFGASTGAAAALWAAADLGAEIQAVVSRGGRPDLALQRLHEVSAPTLLIVGSEDKAVEEMNHRALRELRSAKLISVAGATHLFEEPGALEQVSRHAVRWFEIQLHRKIEAA
jgi:putative phosphoribosyl transferase